MLLPQRSNQRSGMVFLGNAGYDSLSLLQIDHTCNRQPIMTFPHASLSGTSRGSLECGHLGKFARRVTFPVSYSGQEERCHSLKALIHRVRNLQQLKKCDSLRNHSKADVFLPLVCGGLGSSRSNSEPHEASSTPPGVHF